MAYLFYRPCRGCGRKTLCSSAPGTPAGEIERHLFCDACHVDGKAVYDPASRRFAEVLAPLLVLLSILLAAAVFLIW